MHNSNRSGVVRAHSDQLPKQSGAVIPAHPEPVSLLGEHPASSPPGSLLAGHTGTGSRLPQGRHRLTARNLNSTSDRPTTWTRWFRRPRRRYNIRPAFRARAPISHREDIRRFPQLIPAFRAAIIHIPHRVVPGRRPAAGAYRAFRFRDTVNLPVPPGFIGEVSSLFGIRFRCTPRDIRIILPGGRIEPVITEPVRHPQPPSSYTAGRPQNTSAETGTLHSPAGCLHSPVCRNIVV